MGSGSDIPEERLLRLIENPETDGGAVVAMKGPPDWRARLKRMMSLKLPGQRADGDRILFSLKVFSGLMWAVLAALVLYFAAGLLLPKRERPYAGVSAPAPAAVDAAIGTAPPQTPLKPEGQYLDPIQQRNPFTRQAAVEEVEEVVDEEPTAAEYLSTLADGLSVVGINRGPQPDAIIEDVVNKKSYFVKAGDKINQLTVKEIKYDSVVLSYEGEEIEIG